DCEEIEEWLIQTADHFVETTNNAPVSSEGGAAQSAQAIRQRRNQSASGKHARQVVALQKLLNKLPKRERQLLHMQHKDRKTMAEMGAALDITAQQAAGSIAASHQQLRKKLRAAGHSVDVVGLHFGFQSGKRALEISGKPTAARGRGIFGLFSSLIRPFQDMFLKRGKLITAICVIIILVILADGFRRRNVVLETLDDGTQTEVHLNPYATADEDPTQFDDLADDFDRGSRREYTAPTVGAR
ncbi:MAG: hypothetical protein AAFP90_11665, partial [Planctomycetota bacterium]